MSCSKKADKGDKQPNNGDSSRYQQLEFPFMEQLKPSHSGKARRKRKK
jgi:hypothetical protein